MSSGTRTWLERLALQRPPRHGANLRGWMAQVVRNLARRRGRAAAQVLGHELLEVEVVQRVTILTTDIYRDTDVERSGLRIAATVEPGAILTSINH